MVFRVKNSKYFAENRSRWNTAVNKVTRVAKLYEYYSTKIYCTRPKRKCLWNCSNKQERSAMARFDRHDATVYRRCRWCRDFTRNSRWSAASNGFSWFLFAASTRCSKIRHLCHLLHSRERCKRETSRFYLYLRVWANIGRYLWLVYAHVLRNNFENH